MSLDSVPSLRRSRRGGREALLAKVLGALALLFALPYVAMLAYLVVRGGAKVFAFTSIATPLSGVSGETTMRLAVALLLFGGLAWPVATLARRFLRERVPERAIAGVAFTTALILAFTLRDHLPRFLISLPSETRAGGGIAPEIFNTLYAAAISTVVTLPIGVGAAVYIARFAGSRPLARALRTSLDTLASLPSIVYGLFGFAVFVVQMRAGYSLFAGALVLALLNLPIVVGVTEESLAAVPQELEDASLALGASRAQTIFRVTLPYAWPGIVSAAVLSVGRVFAESAPLIMTAGTSISRGNAYSLDPFRGGETLAVHLWYVNSSGLSPDKAEVSAGTAAVLVLLVFLMNSVASKFVSRARAEHA